MQRISKFLSDSGVASRRGAEELIAAGRVRVNGVVIDTPVFFVQPLDNITVNGRPVVRRIGSRVIALHKPSDVMTTSRDPNGRRTVYDILPREFAGFKYIGRLDFKTTGLLLMTNDGDLARRATMPASGLRRVYIAKLRPKNFAEIKSPRLIHDLKEFLSPLSADDNVFDRLRRGAMIDGIKYAPMEIFMISRYPLVVKVVLTEGKKNEIRIAFDHIGLPVAKLQRVSYGPIKLGNLPIGSYRELSGDEMEDLKAMQQRLENDDI